MSDDYETITVIVVTKCLLGYDVKTYTARRYFAANGFTQGQGFIRPRGIFSADQLIAELASTPEPYAIKWEGF